MRSLKPFRDSLKVGQSIPEVSQRYPQLYHAPGEDRHGSDAYNLSDPPLLLREGRRPISFVGGVSHFSSPPYLPLGASEGLCFVLNSYYGLTPLPAQRESPPQP